MTATAPTYKSVATANGGAAAGTAFSITLPAGLSNGDVAYLAVALNSQNDRGDPAGWTLLDFTVQGTVLQQKVYRKTLTAAESSTAVSFTLSNSQKWSAVLVVVSGDAGVDTDTEVWSTGSSSSAWTAGAVTPTVSSGLLLCFHAFRRAATGTVTQTAPTGWTERGETCGSASASPTVAQAGHTGTAPAAGASSGADTDGATNAACSHQISFTLIAKPAAEAASGTISTSGTASTAVAGRKDGTGTISTTGAASTAVAGYGEESSEDYSGAITCTATPSTAVAGRKNGAGTISTSGAASCTVTGASGVAGAITCTATPSTAVAGYKAGTGTISTTAAASTAVAGGAGPTLVVVAYRPSCRLTGHAYTLRPLGAGTVRPLTPAGSLREARK